MLIAWTDKQKQALKLLSSDAKHVMLYGGSRSGKTFLLTHTVFLRALKYPNTRHAIIRQTQTAARRSLWLGTVQDVIASRYAGVALKVNKTDMTVTFPNGSMIEIMGVDEGAKEKMLGNEYTTIYFNECSEMMFSTVSFMYSRLSQKSAAKNKFFYDQNPPHISHWSFPMFVQGINYYTKEKHVTPSDYVSLVLNPADNVQNISEDYIQQLMENMNEQQKQRFIFGQFASDPDEKTVFTNWTIKAFDTDVDAVFQFGCDFGFSVDPTVLIRCYLKERTLYIDHELVLKQCETIDMPKMFLSIPESQRYIIVADSSRPETISHLKRHGFPKVMPSLKGKNSVIEGIELLKGYRIVVHPRCEETINELSFFSYATDKDSGKVLPELAKNQADHCLIAGTMVTTKNGLKPIETITTNDLVLTREGYKPVLFSGRTGVNRRVLKVETSGGSFTCTPNHEVFTANRGFVRADALCYDDDLLIDSETLECLKRPLCATNTANKNFVRQRVLTVTDAGIASEVFDLTIQDAHEFFANGVLVHNCIDALRYACEGFRLTAATNNVQPVVIKPVSWKWR
jgi:PBSX family phage terminase large subunit